MPDLADLIVLVFALGLGQPGLWLVGREVLGDRLRRARVAHLRCPGRWERRLWLIPWRADCWYDLTAIAPGADRTRRCPECGRRSPESRLRGGRRSVRRTLGGLALCALAALTLRGHQIYLSGIAAAPSWMLALVPFDAAAWYEGQPINSGDPWRDQVADELSRRNTFALLDGIGAEIMLRRVREALEKRGEWLDSREQERLHAQLRAVTFADGLEPMSFADAATRLSPVLGTTIVLSTLPVDPAVTYRELEMGPGYPGATLWLATAEVCLPAWPLTGEQALDLLVRRAGWAGVAWEVRAGGVDVKPLAISSRFAAYDTRLLVSTTGLGRMAVDGISGPAAQTMLQTVIASNVSTQAWPADRDFTLRQRAMLLGRASADSLVALVDPLQDQADSLRPAARRSSAFQRGHTGIGRWLVQPLPPPVHRRFQELWSVFGREIDPPPQDRAALLRTLAMLDMPGPIVDVPAHTVEEARSVLARERGISVVIDPVLIGAVDRPAREAATMRQVLLWRTTLARAMLAAPGRILVTDPVTRDLLAAPRMYRLRVPEARPAPAAEPGPVQPPRAPSSSSRTLAGNLMWFACEMAGGPPMIWSDISQDRDYRFIARSTDDQHALLTWLLEAIEGTLRTGEPSAPSADAGWPIAVYDMSDVWNAPGADPGSDRQQTVGADVLRLLSPWLEGSPLGGGARGIPWARRAGPILIASLPLEAHARLREALRQARDAAAVRENTEEQTY